MKITPDTVKAQIEKVTYTIVEGTTTTIAAAVLKNGFVVIGSSACVDINDFEKQVGETIAMNDVVNQVWSFMGYAAKEEQYNQSLMQDCITGQCGTEIE